jgi:DNA-binding XRE family transcriptional regulator
MPNNQEIKIEDLLLTIGRNLSAIRNARRETQEGVAATIGTTHPVISKVENGQYTLTMELLIKLCNHFSVTLQQILELEIAHIFNFTQKNEASAHSIKQYVENELAEGYELVIKQQQSEIEYLRGLVEKGFVAPKKGK